MSQPKRQTKPSEIVEITVESLGGLGDGVATYHDKPLFISKACAGDRLKVRITHQGKDACQGVITEVIAAGPDRQNAPCGHFGSCGGCSLQQLTPDAYRAFKRQMLQTSLDRAGLNYPDVSIEFLPPATRRRVEFKTMHRGGNVALSLHESRSHNLVMIEQCPILDPALQALIVPLNDALSAVPYTKHLAAVSLTATDSGIDMVLTVKGSPPKSLPDMKELCHNLGLARISVRTPDSKPEVVYTATPIFMKLGQYDIGMPPDAFLQASSAGQAMLTTIALEATQHAEAVVDLFSGIGTYSFPLSDHTAVHAVEGDSAMVGGIRNNISRHKIKNLSVEKRDLFLEPLSVKQLNEYQAAIVNPPRVGAKAQTEKLAASTIDTIVMISCNPATFSRDARILTDAGFAMTSVCGLDQFVWSDHLEIASIFRR